MTAGTEPDDAVTDDGGPTDPSQASVVVPARAQVAAVAVLAAGVLVQQCALILGWFRHYVNEDQALLWAAARDWGRLQPHQPNFWGQDYGTTFEAIPTAVLRAAGISYPTGLPLALLLLNLATWWLPAAAAWHRGRRGLAAVAVAAPLVLSTEYAITMGAYGAAAGRFVAGLVVAAVVAWPTRRGVAAFAVGAGAFAALLDASSLLMSVPACAVVLAEALPAERRARLRFAATTASGLLAPLAWFGFTAWWYGAHPDDAMHPAPEVAPSWSVLVDNLTTPSRHFAAYAPELLRWPVLVLAVTVAVVVAVGLGRRRSSSLAAAGFVVVLLATLSMPKSQDELDTVFFLAARTILPFPIGLWFLATLVPRRRPVVARTGRVVASVTALALLTSVVRIAGWDGRGDELRRDAAAFPGFPLVATDDLLQVCHRAEQAAASRGIRTIVFQLRTAAYACAGVIGPDVVTAFPEYERRSWVLHALDDPGPSDIVFVGAHPPICAEARVVSCTGLAPDVVVVHHEAESPLDTIRAIGLDVRPYGDDV